MTLIPWPERLAKNVKDLVGEEIASEVNSGVENIKTEEDQSLWAKKAVDKIVKLIPDVKIQKEILTRCACPHDTEIVGDLKELYIQTGDIDQVLKASYKKIFFTRPVRKGSTIYITKIPANKEPFDKSVTSADKQKYYCHCLNVRTLQESINPVHCYCGAGWYRNIFESILGREVTVEPVKTLTAGDNECVIAISI